MNYTFLPGVLENQANYLPSRLMSLEYNQSQTVVEPKLNLGYSVEIHSYKFQHGKNGFFWIGFLFSLSVKSIQSMKRRKYIYLQKIQTTQV